MTNTSGTINTDNDENDNGRDEKLITIIITLVCVLGSPLTVMSAVSTWLMFSYGRIRRSVLLLAAMPLLALNIIFWKFTTTQFIESWTVVIPRLFSDNPEPFLNIVTALGMQGWLGIPVGALIGLVYSSYRWWTRPRWQEYKFRKTPWEILKKRRIIKEIQNDFNTPDEGMTLGVNDDGERVTQTDKEAVAHTLVIGGAGSGKTTTLMMRLRDSIKNGQGVCFVDLKGGDDVPKILAMYAERYGRNFQHWLIQDQHTEYTGPAKDGPAYYDPLAQGDATRRADMVLELQEWNANNNYFLQISQSYLQLMFTILIQNPNKEVSTLRDAVNLMNPKHLQERAIPLAREPKLAGAIQAIDRLNDEKLAASVRDNLATNRSVLENYTFSVAGPWLDLDPSPNGNNISLLNAAKNGDIVLFSLDSSSYPKLSSSLANLIIQDLKTVSSSLRKDPAQKPFQVIVDEFAAIGSDNIIGLINKSRDAQMPTTLATQTLGDLIKADPAVKDQLMGIVASFIIHRANIKTDAEVYSDLTGTTTRKKFRQTVEHRQSVFGGIGTGIGAGGGAVEDVEENRVTYTEIQDLNIGQMVYINTAQHRQERVKVIPEPAALAFAPHQQIVTGGKEEPMFIIPTSNDNPLSFGSGETPAIPLEAVTLAKDNPQNTSTTETVVTETNHNLLKSFFNNPEETLSQTSPTPKESTPAAPTTPFAPKASPFKPKQAAFPVDQKEVSAPSPMKPTNPPIRTKDEFDF